MENPYHLLTNILEDSLLETLLPYKDMYELSGLLLSIPPSLSPGMSEFGFWSSPPTPILLPDAIDLGANRLGEGFFNLS